MKGILIQQKVFKAIDGRYIENISEGKRLENDEYAYSSIILNLSDSVIRKVGNQNSAKDLWEKLEELYTKSSLPSKLFLLENFFKYKLDVSKTIDGNIDAFTKLVQVIKLTGDKNIDDYTPIVLLNAIPETYSDVKAAIKYGRDNVILDTVISGLKSKEIDLNTNSPSQYQQEVNFVRGRAKNKYGKHRNRIRSESSDRDEKQKDAAIIVVKKGITLKIVESQREETRKEIIRIPISYVEKFISITLLSTLCNRFMFVIA
ncbi:UNVERIFIED_CONTAM: hypothetical protein Sradi_5249000 [Sesamum radiatum]|uniref:Uncharacterized protein n=1 Tax=Sesamum radiatum TaxID=300843 RepID=A0AAW2LKW8_SESRA